MYIYTYYVYIYIPFVHMPYLSPLTSHEYPIKAPNEISLSHLGQGPESLGAASGRSGPGCDHRKVMFNKRKWAKVSVFMIGDFKRLIYIYIYIYISIYIHNCSTFVVEPSCFHVLLLSFPPEITQKSTMLCSGGSPGRPGCGHGHAPECLCGCTGSASGKKWCHLVISMGDDLRFTVCRYLNW